MLCSTERSSLIVRPTWLPRKKGFDLEISSCIKSSITADVLSFLSYSSTLSFFFSTAVLCDCFDHPMSLHTGLPWLSCGTPCRPFLTIPYCYVYWCTGFSCLPHAMTYGISLALVFSYHPMSVENPFTNFSFSFFLCSVCVNFQRVFSDYREVHASAQWVERAEADGISPADRAQRHWMLGTWRGTGIVGNSTVWRKVSIWQQLYFPLWVLFMVLLYVFHCVCVCVCFWGGLSVLHIHVPSFYNLLMLLLPLNFVNISLPVDP